MIYERTIRISLSLPHDIVAALETEAQANCMKPSQVARAILAERLRRRPENRVDE